eukprot:g83041.t1
MERALAPPGTRELCWNRRRAELAALQAAVQASLSPSLIEASFSDDNENVDDGNGDDIECTRIATSSSGLPH